MKFFVLSVLTITVTFCSATSCSFGDTTFFERTAFEQALISFNNVDFEMDYPDGNWADFSTRDGYVSEDVRFVGRNLINDLFFLFVGESDTNNYGQFWGLPNGDFLLAEGDGRITIRLPSGINAIGFDFAIADFDFGENVSITYTDNTGDTIEWQAPAREEQFFGIVSDYVLNRITIETTEVARPPMLILDNFTFGTDNNFVPEPSAALCLGAFAFGVLLRRKR